MNWLKMVVGKFIYSINVGLMNLNVCGGHFFKELGKVLPPQIANQGQINSHLTGGVQIFLQGGCIGVLRRS